MLSSVEIRKRTPKVRQMTTRMMTRSPGCGDASRAPRRQCPKLRWWHRPWLRYPCSYSQVSFPASQMGITTPRPWLITPGSCSLSKDGCSLKTLYSKMIFDNCNLLLILQVKFFYTSWLVLLLNTELHNNILWLTLVQDTHRTVFGVFISCPNLMLGGPGYSGRDNSDVDHKMQSPGGAQ